MNIRTLLLLVFSITYINAGDETKAKLNQILKNVGKRFLNSNTALNSMIINNKNQKLWMEEPDEYVAGVKLQMAERITQHIRWQSSIKDKGYQDHAKTLMDLQDDGMTAKVCESNAEFNKMQFNNYLRRTRSTMDAIQNDAPYSFQVLSTGKETLDMIARIDVQSQSGFKSTVIWNVKSRMVCSDNQCIFKIFRIIVGGGCTDFGTINHNYTELSVRKDALEQLKPGSNPNVQNLFDIFTPGSLKFEEQDENKVKYLWLEGMDSDENLLKLFVCRDGETTSTLYTKEEFNSWYSRFMQMWHPKEGDKDYTTVQILDVKPEEISARITMKLQIGVHPDATVFEWNFKLITSFNQHKDEKWYITRIEVPCQPHIRLIDESYLAYRDLVGATFNSYVSDTKQWHLGMDFVKHFYKKPIDLESCGTKINDIEQLSKTFFVQGDLWNATIKGYMLLEELNSLPAKMDTDFVMRIVMDPPVQVENKLFGSDWTFSIKWNRMDQFYYFYKMVFSCPEWIDKSGEWALKPLEPSETHYNYIRIG